MSQVEKTLPELVRILRPGGYLILREHDCKTELSHRTKYLHFVHAIMMIARVGEFAESPGDRNKTNQSVANGDYEDDTNSSWNEQKSRIIEYTKTIFYRSHDEWKHELEKVGFRHLATLDYGGYGSNNPQQLFYAVYQLSTK
jgi:ubiquinone/menaquinone biosynthesis C-methylase UbiE